MLQVSKVRPIQTPKHDLSLMGETFTSQTPAYDISDKDKVLAICCDKLNHHEDTIEGILSTIETQEDILLQLERRRAIQKFKHKQLESQIQSIRCVKQEPSLVSESPPKLGELSPHPSQIVCNTLRSE